MTAHSWAIVLSVLFVATPAAAGPAPSVAPAAIDFETYKQRGDAARKAGRLAEAAEAYANALALRDDATVAGRAGLVLLELRAYDAAAYQLLHAIEGASGVSNAEWEQFSKAFRTARREVCRVDIVLDQKGAQVEIDGELRQHGPADFWLFVLPGKRLVRARLEGFEDATTEFTAIANGRELVKLALKPVQKKPAAPPISVLQQDKPRTKPAKPSSIGRFVLGGGATFVFGATPGVALGPHIHAAWRSKSWWEVGVDGRAAWALGSIEGFPDARVMTWSTTLAPCARWRERWFGCALVQVDGFFSGAAPNGATYLFGGGFRGGLEFGVAERIRLQVVGDAIARRRGFDVILPTGNAWNGPVVIGSFGARALFLF